MRPKYGLALPHIDQTIWYRKPTHLRALLRCQKRNAELDADWCSKSIVWSSRCGDPAWSKIASFDDHLQSVRRILPGLRFQVGRVPPRRPSASSAALGTFAASHARTAAKRRAADA
jgi:hypothetical protein